MLESNVEVRSLESFVGYRFAIRILNAHPISLKSDSL